MAELKEKIAKLFPDATFEDGDILLVNIADENGTIVRWLCVTLWV